MLSRIVAREVDAGHPAAASHVIPSEANFQRFCSNFLAVGGADNGFEPGRCCSQTRRRRTSSTAPGLAWPPRPGRRAGGRCRRIRPAAQGSTGRSTEWAGTTTRTDITLLGYGHSGAPVRRRHLHVRRRRSCTCTRRTSAVGGLERRRFAVGLPVREPAGERLQRPLRLRRRPPATSSSVPRSVALGDQTGLENWSNVEQRLPVHPRRGHRLRPEPLRTSSTSLTPASRGRCRARASARMTRGSLRAPPARSRTVGSSSWCSTRPTRHDCPQVCRSSSRATRSARRAWQPSAFIHNPDNVETTGFQPLSSRRTRVARTSTRPRTPCGDDGPCLALRPSPARETDGGAGKGQPGSRSTRPRRRVSWESSGIVDASDRSARLRSCSYVQAHTDPDGCPAERSGTHVQARGRPAAADQDPRYVIQRARGASAEADALRAG